MDGYTVSDGRNIKKRRKNGDPAEFYKGWIRYSYGGKKT